MAFPGVIYVEDVVGDSDAYSSSADPMSPASPDASGFADPQPFLQGNNGFIRVTPPSIPPFPRHHSVV